MARPRACLLSLVATTVLLQQLQVWSLHTAAHYAPITADDGDGRAPPPVPGLPRYVWLLWWQGWAHAPYVVRTVGESWKRHNPSWRVLLLDRLSLRHYMNTSDLQAEMTMQARSDIVRLSLLAAHGGVWVDATVLCMEPLDNWLWSSARPAEFWLYDGPLHPMAWFIAASRRSYLVQRWRERSLEYWRQHKVADSYIWVNVVFDELRSMDPRFRQHFRRMPKVSAFAPCQPKLNGLTEELCNRPLEEAVRSCLDGTPPHVVKLAWASRGGLPPIEEGGSRTEPSNGQYAIMKSFGQIGPTAALRERESASAAWPSNATAPPAVRLDLADLVSSRPSSMKTASAYELVGRIAACNLSAADVCAAAIPGHAYRLAIFPSGEAVEQLEGKRIAGGPRASIPVPISLRRRTAAEEGLERWGWPMVAWSGVEWALQPEKEEEAAEEQEKELEEEEKG